ncbi:MAG: hypothetical protein MZU97_21485 [Bacillus subtilis]|nr:hypothetical protein [Bacillus subtilis]
MPTNAPTIPPIKDTSVGKDVGFSSRFFRNAELTVAENASRSTRLGCDRCDRPCRQPAFERHGRRPQENLRRYLHARGTIRF